MDDQPSACEAASAALCAMPRDATQVAGVLAQSARPGPQRIGVELEMGLVRAEDLAPAEFDGPGGIEALLLRLHSTGRFSETVREAGRVVALANADGEAITLEPGGQLELSTAPADDLAALGRRMRARIGELAGAAEELGLWLVGGGLFPAPQAAMPWMPKERYRIMRAYFASLGESGRRAHMMMQRTLSIQVSVDYRSEREALDQLRLAFLAAPVATAIFAASPFDGLESTGHPSQRARAWLATDPRRAGEITAMVAPDATLVDYAEFALDVPMMFRVAGDDYHAMRGASFRDVLEAGAWADGAPTTLDDLWTHLGGIFTDARLKKGLTELRSTDGQRPGEVCAIPAFWIGLMYDGEASAAACRLLEGVDAAARRRAWREVPGLALAAPWGEGRVQEVAVELLSLARQGLERRVAAGLEQPDAPALLDALLERVRAGRTAADELREAWEGPWAREPRRLIESLRFPPA